MQYCNRAVGQQNNNTAMKKQQNVEQQKPHTQKDKTKCKISARAAKATIQTKLNYHKDDKAEQYSLLQRPTLPYWGMSPSKNATRVRNNKIALQY